MAEPSSTTFSESGPSTKRPRSADDNNSKALVLAHGPRIGETSGVTAEAMFDTKLVSKELKRVTLEINPLYLRRLKDRKELGYSRSVGKKKLELWPIEIDVPRFRYAIKNVLMNALIARYHTHSEMRSIDIYTEINEIVPIVSDMCMSALYAKLRSIHRSFGRYTTRYTTAPCYTKDVELPLPFALAIQEFGTFETHSLKKNFIYAPTYPEGVINEGRERQDFSMAEYFSYLPTLKNHGIVCKSVDVRIKTGSPWWTYKVVNESNTSDLICTLPPTHYSDQSAVLRTVFLTPDDEHCCFDIIHHPADFIDYGTRAREVPPGTCTRSFLALCHGPEEEWSFGSS